MQVKRQVNSPGNKRIDYIFSFNDFSPGWTQEVFVELDKNYQAEVVGLNWIQNNKSSEKLDAKLHRDFHMGKMLNTDSKLPLHERIGNRLGIQKANSDHLLHRGKAKGYFKSFGQQRTLVPTRIIIRNMKKILT